MDEIDLKRKYGHQYCFAPYQADMFYRAEIRMHLGNILEACKECHIRPVLADIEQGLKFLAMRDVKADYIAVRLIKTLECTDPEQRYIQVRLTLYDMFKRFNEERLFNWV